jgi:putative SOS response-associated peptidase YedK
VDQTSRRTKGFADQCARRNGRDEAGVSQVLPHAPLPDTRRRVLFFIHRPNREPFAFAGLWDRWVDPDGQTIESCAIITTDANDLVRELHDRMPVILSRDDFAKWLNPHKEKLAELEDLLRPLPPEALMMYPVAAAVNKAGVEGAQLIEPLRQEPDVEQKSLWDE